MSYIDEDNQEIPYGLLFFGASVGMVVLGLIIIISIRML